MTEYVELCCRCNDIVEPNMVHDCIRGLMNDMNRKHNIIMSALLDLELLIKKTRTVNKCVTIRKKNK